MAQFRARAPATLEAGRRPVRWVHVVLRKRWWRAQLLDLLGDRRGWDRHQDDVLSPSGIHGRPHADPPRPAAGYVLVPRSARYALASGPTSDRPYLHRDPGWLDGRSLSEARPALLVGYRVDRTRHERRNSGDRPASQSCDTAGRGPFGPVRWPDRVLQPGSAARTDGAPRGLARLESSANSADVFPAEPLVHSHVPLLGDGC